jgi:CHAT domain-containing protein/Tfp pilus assembly protein PilF
MKNHFRVFCLFCTCFSLFPFYSFSQIITTDTTLANQYFDLAKKYENESKFDTAIFYSEKAQALNINYFGEKSIKNANDLHLLGRLYDSKNKYDLALDYNFKSLQIRKEILGEKHMDVAKSYHNIGLIYDERGEYNKALEYYFEALQVRKEIFGEKHNDVAQTFNNIGIVYNNKGEYTMALEYFSKALQIRKEILGENNPDMAQSYNNIGLIYEDKGESTIALEYYFKALQIRKEILGENNPDVAQSYNNIGSIYSDKIEIDKALEYYFKSLEINKRIFGEKHITVADSYNNIGLVYYDKDEYDKALEYHFKALQIRKELLDEKHPYIAMSYNNIGIVYYEKGEYDNALEYFFKSLQIYKAIHGEESPYVAGCYLNIGNIFLAKGKYDNALEYYFKSLQIRKKVFGEKHPELTKCFICIGSTYSNKGDYNKALEYFQKGISSCLYDFNDPIDVYEAPIIKGYLKWDYLLQCLLSKAEIFTDKRKSPSGLSFNARKKIALRHYQACDTLIDLTRKKIVTQSDKLSLGEKATKVYKEAIDLLTTIQPLNNEVNLTNSMDKDQTLAFYFSEKNKSSVLLEALAGQEAQKYAGIPDSLLQKEHNLKIDIAFCIKQLAEPENIDSTKAALLQDRLFFSNRSYDSLIEVFEKQFPKYHDLKYGTKPTTIKDIQKLLDKRTAMISYSTGDSTITIFTLTKNNLNVKKVPKIKNLEDSIVWFRYGLTNTSPVMQENFRRLGYKLYQQLFPDTTPINGQIENLYLIPDGELSIMPFEALLTSNYSGNLNDYKNYPFLIKRYNISYSYSANLFYQTFSKEASSTIEISNLNDWLAFAPVFDNTNEQVMVESTRELRKQMKWLKTDSLMVNRSMFNRSNITPLPATETETEAIFKLYDNNNLKAKVLLHNSANEQFIKSGGLSSYKILHFATHGFVNSEHPELSGLLLDQDTTGGEDGVLYSGEIYNLKLNADLVVLSACETGLGKIQKGEGIIGLTRALLYAGTKNIIVSLWQVADQSTSDLMVDFYKSLLNQRANSSYSQSLRTAKLKMISEGKYAHPMYWSPFILVGK